MKYRVIVEQDEDGAFVARCASLPDCIGKGVTVPDALGSIKNAITAHLKSEAKQDEMKCDIPDCQAEPIFHYTRIESRRIVFEKWMCEMHARTFVTEFRSSEIVASGTQDTTRDGVCVDLEMMVYFRPRQDTPTPACFYLHEVGGKRRICMTMDEWAWYAMMSQIKQQPAPRPHTHAAWAATINALGGQLQDVLLDRSDGEDWWSAKARIAKDGQFAIVDVRPSDACILAVIHGAPIFVPENVLERFADRGETESGN